MTTETFRNELIVSLTKAYGPEATAGILSVVDPVLYKYDVTLRETALVPAMEHTKNVLETYLSSTMVNGVKKQSAKNYYYVLVKFFREVNIPIDLLEPKDVRKYIADRQDQGMKPASLTKTETILQQFFRWCVDEEYLPRSPMKGIKIKTERSQERKPLTKREIILMRENCVTSREKALIEFFLSTGCRISEASNARLEDIDWQENSLMLYHTKGDKSRKVYFSSEFQYLLGKYLEERNDDYPYLFVAQETAKNKSKNHKMSTYGLRKDFNAVKKRTGIKREITPHYLRHTFATGAISHGMDLLMCSKILGHSSPEVTARTYTHISAIDVKRSYDRYVS